MQPANCQLPTAHIQDESISQLRPRVQSIRALTARIATANACEMTFSLCFNQINQKVSLPIALLGSSCSCLGVCFKRPSHPSIHPSNLPHPQSPPNPGESFHLCTVSPTCSGAYSPLLGLCFVSILVSLTNSCRSRVIIFPDL